MYESLRNSVSRWIPWFACSASIAVAACAPPADTTTDAVRAEPVVLWNTTEGIDTPESAYVDADSGSIFVTQVAGDPTGRDGNGRIVRLGTDGTVLAADWATGLNAPKGLRRHEGMLWTADIDEVVGFDIATGAEAARVRIEGAQFLNDLAVGPDGTVYVSDMMANRIYTVRNGAADIFAEGEHLEWPNGILYEDGRLVVGGWGRPAADFTTEVPGRLYTLDLMTREKTLITPEPFASIDGVESDGRGGYIITDWLAGKMLQIMADGTVNEVAELGQGTADLAFIPADGTAIVPHMTESRVAAYDVSALLD